MHALLTLKDEMTGTEYVREVGFLTEFYQGGENYRLREINRWIEERGNPQHNTFLSLVGYELVR